MTITYGLLAETWYSERHKVRQRKLRMPDHPLAEVFGFPVDNFSGEATRYRGNKLCPFNNKVPNCTKDKANDPLGVCSIFDGEKLAITCPVRFRQGWLIVEDAASFFFPADAKWTTLTEVRLRDKQGKSAGNIDVVLVQYDDNGKVLDFGSLEIQAVYISGNVRRPFEAYMQSPESGASMDWSKEPNYPRPDYLSSSRKRLAPQLLYKGGILSAWNKKIGVALDKSLFSTLPTLQESESNQVDIAWFVYDLQFDQDNKRYFLVRDTTVYTTFSTALEQITRPEAGSLHTFVQSLQVKLDDKLNDSNPPDTQEIDFSLL